MVREKKIKKTEKSLAQRVYFIAINFYSYGISWSRGPNPEDQINRKPEDPKMTKRLIIQKTIRPKK